MSGVMLAVHDTAAPVDETPVGSYEEKLRLSRAARATLVRSEHHQLNLRFEQLWAKAAADR